MRVLWRMLGFKEVRKGRSWGRFRRRLYVRWRRGLTRIGVSLRFRSKISRRRSRRSWGCCRNRLKV